MKKSIITTIAIALVFAVGLTVIGVGSSGFSNWNAKSWFNSEVAETPISKEAVSEQDINVQMFGTPTMLLSSAPAMAATENGYTKAVTLTATVLPADVPDKSVDWFIEWSDISITETVTDYVTITPVSDGALSATVTCEQSFNNDIVVTVVTRVGKNSATCLVTYVGAPETVSVVGNGITASSLSGVGSYYALPTGSTYTFTLTGENGFGDVRTACNYTYNVSAVGNIITQDRKYTGTTGTNTYIDGTEGTVAIKDITKVTTYIASAFDYAISGNQLSITSNATLTGYYSSSVRSGQNVTYYDSFKSYENDSWYYTVTVTETNSGASQTIKFRPVASVASISLNSTTVGF